MCTDVTSVIFNSNSDLWFDASRPQNHMGWGSGVDAGWMERCKYKLHLCYAYMRLAGLVVTLLVGIKLALPLVKVIGYEMEITRPLSKRLKVICTSGSGVSECSSRLDFIAQTAGQRRNLRLMQLRFWTMLMSNQRIFSA